MKTKSSTISLVRGIVALSFVLALALVPFLSQSAFAAQITTRSLTLQTGSGGDGGSKPGGTVKHQFAFTLPGGSSVGSIKFQYCTTAADTGSSTCVTPTGLVTTGASLENETGATGFTINNSTNGAPYLTRTASAVGANSAVTYRLNNVVNPTTTNYTFFVRMATYSSTDATGTPIDTGSVAASTATPIVLDGTMPESLVFCTGATVTTTSSVPDCATATPGTISFNQLFSPTATAIASSQMAASTNAGSGYAITVNGPTLTSGSNTVSGMTSAGASVKGVAQFGLNLKTNTTAASLSFPASSAEVAPAANGTNYRGQAATNYDTADTFKFISGDVVANSYNGGAGGTDAQIYTVSYIANVPGSQPAGTYTTTLTYICTPTY